MNKPAFLSLARRWRAAIVIVLLVPILYGLSHGWHWPKACDQDTDCRGSGKCNVGAPFCATARPAKDRTLQLRRGTCLCHPPPPPDCKGAVLKLDDGVNQFWACDGDADIDGGKATTWGDGGPAP